MDINYLDRVAFWYEKRPKLMRFAIKTMGVTLAFISAPFWAPLMIALWLILRSIIGIIDMWEKV